MSEAVLIVEILTNPGVILLTGSAEQLSFRRGDAIEIARSTAFGAKELLEQPGRATVRYARPGETYIPAPPIAQISPWTAESVLADHIWADAVLDRAQKEFLRLNILPEGCDTWQRYAASRIASEYNAARAEGIDKADAADAWCVARAAEHQQRELAELTAKLKAIQGEIKRNASIVRKPALSQKAELGEKMKKLLEAALKPFDGAVLPKLAQAAQPFIEQAQSALAAEQYELVPALAEKIKEALTTQIEWTTEKRPGMYGDSVTHLGAHSKLGPPLH